MGIDFDSLLFTKYYVNENTKIEKILTIGRQRIHIYTGQFPEYDDEPFGEELLSKTLNCNLVDSLDFSDYEGANIVHDLNKPIDKCLHNKYDLLLDFGTIEHVFDIKQALSNIQNLTSIGGKVIHVVPCNGYCGHGLYQFSPELFFNFYSLENGWENTELFITLKEKWFKVKRPKYGDRVQLTNYLMKEPSLVMVGSTKVNSEKVSTDVLQSDYEFLWEESKKINNEFISQKTNNNNKLKSLLKRIINKRNRSSLRKIINPRWIFRNSIDRHPDIEFFKRPDHLLLNK